MTLDPTLYEAIREILCSARNEVCTSAGFAMLRAYWAIGKRLAEQENNEKRSATESSLLAELSEHMIPDFGKGFTSATLRHMRLFYAMFPDVRTLSSSLSWSHYRLLMRVEDGKARQFYLDECTKAGWSVRQLDRQIHSFFYDRRDKCAVAAETRAVEVARQSEDMLRDPHVLDFLGFEPSDSFFENDLEQALLDHLQKFLLDLERGFAFVARHKSYILDGQHFSIDLLFYHYILKCFVLIDLKLGDLTHQELDKMQMSVHYAAREMMNEGDNLPIGLILCVDKRETLVRYTLPENRTQALASTCKRCLPSEEELRIELGREYQVLEDNRLARER